MGHGSNFIVSRGSVVKVADPVRGEGCFKSCICSTSGELSPCVNQPCTEIQKSCQFDNELKGLPKQYSIFLPFYFAFFNKLKASLLVMIAKFD